MKIILALAAALIIILGWIGGAAAFVIIEITPATFPNDNAGFVISFNTAQERPAYIFTILFPERRPPQLPLPVFPIAYRTDAPPGGLITHLPPFNLTLHRTTREAGSVERMTWHGLSNRVAVRGAGETRVWAQFRAGDLRALQRAAATKIIVVASGGYQTISIGDEHELLISDMLAAPLVVPPPFPAPMPPAPPLLKPETRT